MLILFFWVFFTVVLIAIEAATVQLVTVWFALGSLSALVACLFNLAPGYQWLVFISVSLISLLTTRPLVKKFTKNKIQPTNADRNIGAQGIVTETINNIAALGQVSVNSMNWTARSKDGEIIEEGTKIADFAIEGAKLIVERSYQDSN